jgi:outer membrane protein
LELSWTTRQNDRWYIQVDLGLDGEREEDDSDDGRLDGLDERDDEFTGTGEVRYALDEEWRNYVGTRISVGDSDFGTQRDFSLPGTGSVPVRMAAERKRFLYAKFGDGNHLNREFGISPSEAVASGLAETDLDDGYRSSGLRLVDRRFASEHIQIVSGLEFEYYSNDVQDSPIAREDFALEVELGVLYHF